MKKIGIVAVSLVTVCIVGLLIMTLYLNQRNGKKFKQMGKNEDFFRQFFSDIESQTWCKVLITSGYRDTEKQKILYEKNPDNAKPGKSRHEKRKAMDINLICWDGMLQKSSSKADWKAKGVHLVAKKNQVIWGGNFTNYHDPIHFALR